MSGESIELISNDTVDICYSDILILANSIKNFTTRIKPSVNYIAL